MVFNKKAKRLKKEGLCYDTSILKIVPNYMVTIGFSTLAHIECSYQHENGETHTVKSKSFMLPFGIEFLSKEDMVKNGHSSGNKKIKLETKTR